MLAEFKMHCSPVEAGEISRNAWKYGHAELTVELSTEFWFIDEGVGGFQSPALHMWNVE
jgi:hypothetical protein